MIRRQRLLILAGLGATLALVAVLTPLASPAPDGLEKVASDTGFLAQSTSGPVWHWAALADYGVPGIRTGWLATTSAGVIGTVAVFICCLGLARVRTRRNPERDDS